MIIIGCLTCVIEANAMDLLWTLIFLFPFHLISGFRSFWSPPLEIGISHQTISCEQRIARLTVIHNAKRKRVKQHTHLTSVSCLSSLNPIAFAPHNISNVFFRAFEDSAFLLILFMLLFKQRRKNKKKGPPKKWFEKLMRHMQYCKPNGKGALLRLIDFPSRFLFV